MAEHLESKSTGGFIKEMGHPVQSNESVCKRNSLCIVYWGQAIKNIKPYILSVFIQALCLHLRRPLLVAVGVVHVLQHAHRHQERRRDPLPGRSIQLCQVASSPGQLQFNYRVTHLVG